MNSAELIQVGVDAFNALENKEGLDRSSFLSGFYAGYAFFIAKDNVQKSSNVIEKTILDRKVLD